MTPTSRKANYASTLTQTKAAPGMPAATHTSAALAANVVIPNTAVKEVDSVRSLPTPLHPPRLAACLSGYHRANFLVRGFSLGFRIPSSLPGDAHRLLLRNHPSALEHPLTVTAKIRAELDKGRIAGPFSQPPLPNFVTSPLGLVPKREPGQFRLIHDLSFPKGDSVNSHIPPHHCSVQYLLLDHCVEQILALGKGCLVAKADLKDAFRIVPISPKDYRLLGFSWQGAFYYDKCLPMGCSVSCAIFEELSCALQWILTQQLGVSSMSHILDDFMFFAPSYQQCLRSLQAFELLCGSLGLPVKQEKTVLPATSVILHGILVDSVAMELRLPDDKVEECLAKLRAALHAKSITLRSLQSLLGSLNFACRAIVPGRPFLRRLFDLTSGVVSPHHHIRLAKGARRDLQIWIQFLTGFNGRCLMLPAQWQPAAELSLFSDASGAGAAAMLGSAWFQLRFPDRWLPFHISVKEFLPIVLALQVWGPTLANKRLLFHCDNSAVVHVINSQTSKDPSLAALLRRLVLSTLQHNILCNAVHIPGVRNITCDALSRFQLGRARQASPDLHPLPVEIPQDWHTWFK